MISKLHYRNSQISPSTNISSCIPAGKVACDNFSRQLSNKEHMQEANTNDSAISNDDDLNTSKGRQPTEQGNEKHSHISVDEGVRGKETRCLTTTVKATSDLSSNNDDVSKTDKDNLKSAFKEASVHGSLSEAATPQTNTSCKKDEANTKTFESSEVSQLKEVLLHKSFDSIPFGSSDRKEADYQHISESVVSSPQMIIKEHFI